MIKQKKYVQCANCGGIGHIFKRCYHPITSYGIICYRLHVDNLTNAIYPEYLMIQRKDSLCYVEFLRGKYKLEQTQYILSMFENMTANERESLLNNNFEDLWKSLWQVKNCSTFFKEYQDAERKFNLLKKGFIITDLNKTKYECFSMSNILETTKPKYIDTEWGFPKGRRNINESDIDCAMREFSEETGVPAKHLYILPNFLPVEEVFVGSNNIRYKHAYFIASYNKVKPISLSKTQLKEVKNACWFKYHDAQNNIREQNVERKEIFRRVNNIIMKYFYNINNKYVCRKKF